MTLSTDSPSLRRGKSAASSTASALGTDEMSVVELMRSMERRQQPGAIVVYFNGNNFTVSEDVRLKWLPNT